MTGTLVCEGPENFGLELHLVLAERGVLFPGESRVVIHRMVARSDLLGSVSGAQFEPKAGALSVPFHGSLAAITWENEKFLEALESAGGGTVVRMSTEIDPHQVTLVGYIRDWMGNVLQAVQIDPKVVEEEAK